MMGASNPHRQIWANESLPNVPAREQQALSNYEITRHSCMLCDYLKLECMGGERLVFES